MPTTVDPEEFGRLVARYERDGFPRFLNYWLELRGDRPLPAYRDFDPTRVPFALSSLFVVEDRGGVLRYRLAGEEIQSRYHTVVRGKTIFDLLSPRSAAVVEERWKRMLGGPHVGFIVTDHHTVNHRSVTGVRLQVPFADAAGDPRFLMCLVRYVSTADYVDMDQPLILDETYREVLCPAAEVLATPSA
ncbi:MAG: PAS domain-containing protein [Alphaproteobacteria bacterium]|nr:PAS domain-containing protein [Alphaproteobacteria bacterium]